MTIKIVLGHLERSVMQGTVVILYQYLFNNRLNELVEK